MTSNWQTLWSILSDYATRSGIFEIDDAVPEIATKLNVTDQEARRETAFLLGELARLPEGGQFFRVEGNAVVPLPEYLRLPPDPETRQNAYPFEL